MNIYTEARSIVEDAIGDVCCAKRNLPSGSWVLRPAMDGKHAEGEACVMVSVNFHGAVVLALHPTRDLVPVGTIVLDVRKLPRFIAEQLVESVVTEALVTSTRTSKRGDITRALDAYAGLLESVYESDDPEGEERWAELELATQAAAADAHMAGVWILITDLGDGEPEVEVFSSRPTFADDLSEGGMVQRRRWLREGSVDGGDSIEVARYVPSLEGGES